MSSNLNRNFTTKSVSIFSNILLSNIFFFSLSSNTINLFIPSLLSPLPGLLSILLISSTSISYVSLVIYFVLSMKYSLPILSVTHLLTNDLISNSLISSLEYITWELCIFLLLNINIIFIITSYLLNPNISSLSLLIESMIDTLSFERNRSWGTLILSIMSILHRLSIYFTSLSYTCSFSSITLSTVSSDIQSTLSDTTSYSMFMHSLLTLFEDLSFIISIMLYIFSLYKYVIV